jgi:hypothetical protein
MRRYLRIQDWEVIEMDPLPRLSGHDPTFGPPREPLRDFLAVAGITRMINAHGCSHGDLHVRNAGRNVENGLSVFDFDQALSAHPLRCMLRDFLGLAGNGARCQVSLFDRACDVQGIGIIPRALKKLKRGAVAALSALHELLRPTPVKPVSTLTARVALQHDPALDSLAKAWELAARSNASAPGVNVAYYSLDVEGINFPGERPWLQRWDCIKKTVEFRGKRFLELGCNMGLLAIHARLAGAQLCVAADVDSDVLEAAKLAARGFGADVEFRQLDLNEIDKWGPGLEQFDIVSAMSVMHWVQNKERVWSFLALFPELLYEGHESEAEAEEALQKAGFKQIVRLGPTERNRPMFLARKAHPQ